MEYQEYIDLGFERTDMHDAVVFRQTGFYGYCLEKIFSNTVSICVSSESLNNPKLYIKKSHEDSCHIIPLTCEMVKDLIDNPLMEKNPFLTCC